ncbi:MAG TPA: hypothetical protein PLU53_14600 [Bacteroidia bacterium]|nr:hypothetical protein [Bacteroidia bacterium]
MKNNYAKKIKTNTETGRFRTFIESGEFHLFMKLAGNDHNPPE